MFENYARLVDRAYSFQDYTTVPLPAIKMYGSPVDLLDEDYQRFIAEFSDHYKDRACVAMSWKFRCGYGMTHVNFEFLSRHTQQRKLFFVGNNAYTY